MKWETKELGEIAQIVSGSTPKRNNSKFWDGEIFFATPKDLSNLSSKYLEKTANKITKEGLESCSTQILPINSILLSSRAPIGLVAITKVALCTNQGFKSLVLKNNISPDYVYYFLKASTKQLNALGRGATFKEISKKIVGKVQIPLPPLTEQRRIAAILDKADALRARTRAQLAAYDELLQAVFLDMFGDPVLNEKGWEVKPMRKTTTKIGSGATPKGGKKAYKSHGISLIRSMNIHDHTFAYKNLAFINHDQAQKLDHVTVEKNDVLLNITGASVTRCAIAPKDILPARVNQHVCILRPQINEILPEYLAHVLVSKNFKNHLLNLAKKAGATREALTKGQLGKLLIPVPPISFQKVFTKTHHSISSQKRILERTHAQSDDLFNSLLQRAFRGEL